jgi:hypothetical protein
MAQDDLLAWRDEGGAYHAVAVDIVTSHEDDRTAEITSFPVENGANISDHIIQQPNTLTLEVCQTQSPFPSPARPGSIYTAPKGFSTKAIVLDVRKSLFKPGGLLALTQAVGSAAGSALNALGVTTPESDVVKATVFVSDTPVDRIGELHDQLIQIKENGRPCKIVFRGKVYPDYFMTRVNWKTQKGEVGLGRFSLSFQAVRTVETATTELPDPSSLRLKPSKAQAKPPKPVDPASAPAVKGDRRESNLSVITGHSGR